MVFGVDDEPAGNGVPVGEPAWSESFLGGPDVTGAVLGDVSWDGSSPGGRDGVALDGSLFGADAVGGVDSDGLFVHEPANGDSVLNGSSSDGLAGPGSSGSSLVGGCGLVEFDRLVEAVDAALDIDFEGVPGGMLADMAPLMASVLNRVQAVDARFVEALDASGVWVRRGHRNVTAMLASGNAHRGDSAGRARRASRLTKMRLVEAAFVAGDITVDHVRLLGELTQRRWLESFGEAESYLVASAVELSWREFAHVVEV